MHLGQFAGENDRSIGKDLRDRLQGREKAVRGFMNNDRPTFGTNPLEVGAALSLLARDGPVEGKVIGR